ncbi:MAG: tyrosine-type recombinase/integrase [Clostridia bacterium]|nr:tyrosine-type recombinase/integrase [Clostridia bacterium]
MQWSEGIQEFGFDCKVRKLSPKTIDNYSKQLRYFQRYLQSEFELVEIEKVKAYHVKQFLAWMDDKGRQPRYINDLLKVFKTFFNYMVKEGHMAESPAAKVKNMKQPKTKIITFSENEIRKILNFYSGRTYLEIRNRTMIAMFFDTGMRLTEVITLKWEQVREEYILVHGKGAKERLVPVSPYLAKALMQYRQTKESYFDGKLPENYVFVSQTGKKLTAEAITKVLKKAAKVINVNPQVRVSPHTCRHTFAHLQLKNGIDLYTLSRLMGHENVAITQRYLEGIKDDEVLQKAQKAGVLANL